MNIKFAKPNLLSIGIVSAMSATFVLLGSISAKAQTGSGTLNQSPDSNTLNQSPNPINSPIPSNGTQTPLNQPTQQNQIPSQPSQGITPGQSSPLSRYSTNQAPYISYGSRGQTVRDVQTFLNQQGLYNGSIDGIYGPQTRNAVLAYQRSRNLVADGIIGPRTWGTMLSGQSEASNF